MILLIGGIKGGIGKTTVATNLAVMRQAAGNSVILVDADEQRSASEFVEQRAALKNGILPSRQASGRDTIAIVRELAEEYEDVVIDVGGRDTVAQRSAMLAADLVLLPMPAGSFDAWTLPQAETLIREVRQANSELDAASFISRGYVQGKDNAEAAEILRASHVLRFLETPLIERRVFARSSGDGLAVTEFKPEDKKASKEALNLYNAVFNPVAS